MKQFILFACLFGQVKASYAQVFDQRATLNKLALEEIAALSAYAQEARQGYQIVQNGLNTIKAITSGEFNLHTIFFVALAGINPKFVIYVQDFPPAGVQHGR